MAWHGRRALRQRRGANLPTGVYANGNDRGKPSSRRPWELANDAGDRLNCQARGLPESIVRLVSVQVDAVGWLRTLEILDTPISPSRCTVPASTTEQGRATTDGMEVLRCQFRALGAQLPSKRLWPAPHAG
jgi:hypothetical protein